MALNFTNNQNSSPGSMPPPMTPQAAQNAVKGAEDLLINYNKKFEKGTPAKYRDKEIFTVLSQLTMSQKSCSLLVGAPGVGKTKIVEEIARLIANQSPYTCSLNEYTIYELPLTNLMSGTQFRGDLEQKVQNLLEFCEDPKNKVILFIDEIHQLVGHSSSYDSTAQMFKPAMARGSIKMIGATTLQESKNLLDDPAFNRRFNRVNVCELSIEQTKDIIEEVYIPKMSQFYSVSFGKNVAETITNAAEKSKTITCHRPDNAITMLDQVCSNTVLQRNYNIATCDDEQLKQTMLSNPLVINVKHIDDYNKDLTFKLSSTFDDIKNDILYRDEVIDKAYNALNDYIKINTLFPDKKPFKLMITGEEKSGKTTLAKKIAEKLDEQPIYLDLADYSDAPSLNRIIGSPLGYVGSDSKQEMPFDLIESNPRKVIILDNMDKTNRVVADFFDSALDTALIKYADNRMIDISKCIIIITNTEIKHTAKIGFVTPNEKESKTELTLKKLSNEELVKGANYFLNKMIQELKATHTKYTKLPDNVELTEDETNQIVNAEDMMSISKLKILEMI